jgi:hypothetical protein
MRIGAKVMAKIWVRETGQPWPSHPKTTNPFRRFIKKLNIQESDWIEDMMDRANLPPGVYVELGDAEATNLADWDAGLYRSSVSPEDLDEILK